MKSIVLFLTLNSFLLVSSYTLKVQRETLNFQSNNPQNFQKFLSLFDRSPKLSLEAQNQILANYYQKFDKDPSRFTEERRQIILENYQKVLEHNEKFQRGETLFKMELNHFSDFTDDELKILLPSKLYKPAMNRTLPPLKLRSDTPASFDWNDNGNRVVQPVQNQARCGSCYAFASIAAIEGSMCIHHKACTKLSEQEAMECTRGCEGGNYQLVYDYAKDGCAYEDNYPYQGYVQQGCSAHGERAPHSNVVDYKDLSHYNADELKEFIYKNGPIYVAFEVPDSFMHYRGGIFDDCQTNSQSYHAVLIVGYGSEGGADYWKVKNSWSPRWGESGFFKIKRGIDCVGMETLSPSYPLTG